MRYGIDITTQSETCFADEKLWKLTEAGCGYTFLWIGRPANEPRTEALGTVSLAISNSVLLNSRAFQKASMSDL